MNKPPRKEGTFGLLLVSAIITLVVAGLMYWMDARPKLDLPSELKKDCEEDLRLKLPSGVRFSDENTVYVNDEAKVIYTLKMDRASHDQLVAQINLGLPPLQQVNSAISDLGYYFPDRVPADLSHWIINNGGTEVPYSVSLFYNGQSGDAMMLLVPVD